MGRNQNKSASIERQKRLINIEKCLLAGFTNQIELAARFGVSQPMICQDIKLIQEGWVQYGPNNQRERRMLRIRQLEKVMQVATDSFVKSQENTVEDSTATKLVVCPNCGGVGANKKGTGACKKCKGEGTVEEETTKHTVKGTAGEPSFLKCIVECVKEINKLEGNYKPKKLELKGKLQGMVLHADLSNGAGDLAGVHPDVLIQAKTALEGLKQAIKISGADLPEVVQGRIIRGKVVPPEEQGE